MNNYNRVARSILGEVRRSIRGFCCSVNISPSLLMMPAIDDKGLLIMPSSSSSSSKNINAGCLNMYNLIEKKMISVPKLGPGVAAWKADILCPETALCVGSSHGWLAFLNPQNQSMFLLNPINKYSLLSYIPLPPVETFPETTGYRMFKSDHRSATPSLIPYFVSYLESGGKVQKLILSMPPPRSYLPGSSIDRGGGDDCFVAMIMDGAIAYCPLGGEEWDVLSPRGDEYEDIIYSPRKKTLYAIRQDSYKYEMDIYTWNLTDQTKSSLKANYMCPKHRAFFRGITKKYLVESQEGDLFCVIRYVAKGGTESGTEYRVDRRYYLESSYYTYYLESSYYTDTFDVYKLVDVKDNNNNSDKCCWKWKPLKSLGERAIFVGMNHSYCLNTGSGRGTTTTAGYNNQLIKGNCIYYSDDSNYTIIKDTSDHNHPPRGHDFGVFDYGADMHDEDQHFLLNDKITSIDDVNEFLSPPVWVIPASCSDTFIQNSCYSCINDKNKCVHM